MVRTRSTVLRVSSAVTGTGTVDTAAAGPSTGIHGPPMDWGVGPESIGRWTARRLDQLPRSAWPTLSGLDWRDRPRSELDCPPSASPSPVHWRSIGGTAWSIMQSNCALDCGSCQSISARSDSDRRDDLVQTLDSMCTFCHPGLDQDQ